MPRRGTEGGEKENERAIERRGVLSTAELPFMLVKRGERGAGTADRLTWLGDGFGRFASIVALPRHTILVCGEYPSGRALLSLSITSPGLRPSALIGRLRYDRLGTPWVDRVGRCASHSG